MKKKSFALFCSVSAAFFCSSLYAQTGDPPPARIWEEEITLPTYLIGEEGKNPRFYFGRAYQGAQGRVYPYASQEFLTDVRVDKTYNTLFLENEFVQVSLLPEIGGRLFSALDKTNNYDFIYKQEVIRPALIGMLGAWITGGIEWNVFHHHRATSFTPVDFAVQENQDGSVTAWIGEFEIRHCMKWRLGLSVYPGKSYIEATLIPYNRSPFPHSILYFANAGVHANDDYQVIFDPSTEWVTQHAKREYAGWPIAHEIYNRVNFDKQGMEFGTDGVDISWWKNNITQISFFAYNYEADWMAGYDHGKESGTCIVGSNYTAPGKKFWTWGNGPQGRAWDKILTETDGPELELMAGGYSDNEPDYSWIQPYETKKVTHYLYPLRDMMGGVKNANKEAAVNLELTEEGTAVIAFNTTSRRNQAKVLLKAGENLILEETVNLNPGNPFHKEVNLPSGISRDELKISLLSSEGQELVSYTPKKESPGAFPGYAYEGDLEKGTRTPMPEPVRSPGHPESIKTIEMLYLAGMRIEQFYSPSVDPMVYYNEALSRDPGDLRVNTAVGILMLRNGRFKEAEKYLKKATEKAVWNYTRPRDAESFYYHGLALEQLGKLKDAYDEYYVSTWDHAFHSAGYYQLAQLDCIKKDYHVALEHLDASLSTTANNLNALNLKAAVIRKTGDTENAAALAKSNAAYDLLDFWSRNELYLSQLESDQTELAEKTLQSLKNLMRDQVNSYLMLAVEYGNCGMWDEAIDVVQRLINTGIEGTSTYPLLYYYAAYGYEQTGDPENAAKYYTLANQMPVDYCFPFQLEMIHVLNAARKHNPQDEKAPYYLGNLLFDLQPDAAMELWEESIELGAGFATVYRNLGLGYDQILRDLYKSMDYYKKALELNPDDSKVIFELADVQKKAQEPHEKRLAMLQQYHDYILASDYLMGLEREIELYTLLGEYDKALEMMKGHHFRRWEGGANVYTSFVDANLLRGMELMENGQYEDALEYIKTAGEYPGNMEASKRYASDRSSETGYFLGVCYEAMGRTEQARKAFSDAAAERQYDNRWDIPMFHHAMALKKLGKDAEANRIFQGIIRESEQALQEIESSSGISFFAKFGERQTEEVRRANEHYLTGLGMLGLDQTEKAIQEFKSVAELDINNVWAKFQLTELNQKLQVIK